MRIVKNYHPGLLAKTGILNYGLTIENFPVDGAKLLALR
jgi:hypothetical protein